MEKTQTLQTNPKTSEFNGGMLGLLGITLLQLLLIVVTLTIGAAWANCMYYRWYAKHTKIDGKQVAFDGKGIQLFGNYVKWFLLTVITLGIYGLWVGVKMEKWKLKHTYLLEEEKQEPVPAGNPYAPAPMQPMQYAQPVQGAQQQAYPASPYPLQGYPFPVYPYAPLQTPYGYPQIPQNGANGTQNDQ